MNINPLLTVLNYSAGTGSTCILHMVLRGEIERPENLIVLTADPRMENSLTYRHYDEMCKRMDAAGIEHYKVQGPSLKHDLLTSKDRHITRLDNPPYWTWDCKTYTKSGKKKVGQLTQKCTAHYKIAPMDRYIRRLLESRFGISAKSKRIGEGIVKKLIGFSSDEEMRVKPSRQKYVTFAYPLIELGMTKRDVAQWYIDHGETIPPRSVCNACFANGAEHYRKMYEERPDEWLEAVAIDEAVRDSRHLGIVDQVYVFRGCIPLLELKERGFVYKETGTADAKDFSCDSGYCFT